MEAPVNLLNEPYILSPYKLCVANFVLAYMEQKNASETAGTEPPNPLFHCHLGFRLIMSLDCSYAELRSQMVSPIELGRRGAAQDAVFERIDSSVLKKFDGYLVDIKIDGIHKLYDFSKRVQRVLAKKPGTGGKHNHSVASEELYRINRLSMAGLFLRKFIIHFERLDFIEVATLFTQLDRYLQGEAEFEYLPVQPMNPILSGFQKNEPTDIAASINQTPKIKKSGKLSQETSKQPKSGAIELNAEEITKLDRLEAKLLHCDPASELVRHLKSMIEQVKRFRVPFDETYRHPSTKPLYPDFSESDSEPVSPYSSASSMSLDDSSNMDITKESSMAIGEKSTRKKIRKQLRKTLTLNSSSIIQPSDFSKIHWEQASQHFLLKQVYKILINEHSALAPPAIVDFINYYFEQHNRFHYNQFIQLNYRANLNMIGRVSSIDGGGTGSGSAGSATGAGGGASAQAGGGAAANGANTGTGANAFGGNAIGAPGPTNRKIKDLFRSINYHSDIYYLKFINALRVNNVTAAKECFYTYFDLKKSPRLPGASSNSAGGPIGNGLNPSNSPAEKVGFHQSSGSNFCWSALNLAIMHVHFRHYRLAYEALTDCISVARERRDERCLQYAMIWLLLVLQQFDGTFTTTTGSITGDASSGGGQSRQQTNTPNGGAIMGTFRGAGSSTNRTAQNRAAELSHRHQKAYSDLNLIQNLLNLIAINEYSLPYIAAMAYLHLEKQIYLRPSAPTLLDQDISCSGTGGKATSPQQVPRRPPLTTKPLILAVRYLMDDILMKSYASHAAVLNAYGALHLGSIMSSMLARLDLVDMVDQELIAHVNESQAIACRNLAFYQWTVRGNYSRAMEVLTFFSKYYSPYNNAIRQVIEAAKEEITFERCLYIGDWASALKAISLVRLTNRTLALMMQAELRRRQNEPVAALECIDFIHTPNEGRGGGGGKNARIPFVGATLTGGTNEFSRNGALTGEMTDIPAALMIVDDEESVLTSERGQGLKMRPSVIQSLTTPKGSRTQRTKSHSHHPTVSTATLKNGASSGIPSTLEPEEERPLTVELDPYSYISCTILKSAILSDLSGLLDCVVKAQSHGFRVLETRALLEIARIQQSIFGQLIESQQTVNSLMIRLVANGALKDLASAYFLTGTNHFLLHQKGGHEPREPLVELPLRLKKLKKYDSWTLLNAASWANGRAMAIWRRLEEKTALLESLHLAAFIANEGGDREKRNAYAKQAKLLRTEIRK